MVTHAPRICPCSSHLCQYNYLGAGQLPRYQKALLCCGRIQNWTSNDLNSSPSSVVNLETEVFCDQATSEIPSNSQIFLVDSSITLFGIVGKWLNIKHGFSP